MPYKIINRKIKNVLNELKKHNKLINHKLYKNYTSKYNDELWVIGLYFRLINYIKDISVLLDNSANVAGILVLIRSCLDCYLSIQVLLIDPDKLKGYEKNKLTQETQAVIATSKSHSEPVLFLSYLENVCSKFRELENVIPKFLKEKDKRLILGCKILVDKQYTQQLKILNTKYLEAVYKNLCEHVHSGHLALMECQVKKNHENYRPSQIDDCRNVVLFVPLILLMQIIGIVSLDIFNKIKVDEPINNNFIGISDAVCCCIDSIISKMDKHDLALIFNHGGTSNAS